MHIFKTACKVMFRHPLYLLIYVAFLGLMGVFVSAGVGVETSSDTDFLSQPVSVAVVNRDGGALAAGLVQELEHRTTVIYPEDERRTLQDVIAQSQAECIFIIPEGFTEEFMDAVHNGDEPPALDVILGDDTISGLIAENVAESYLGSVALQAAINPAMSAQTAAANAIQAADQGLEASYVSAPGSAMPIPESYTTYNRWTTYPMMCALGVLMVMMMRDFNRGDVRRRTLTSPKTGGFISGGLAAAGFVVMLICWGWLSVQGFVAMAGSLTSVEPWRIGLCMFASFTFALFALAFGFLISQCGLGELMANAVSNIVGLVLAFMGGAWSDITAMAPALEQIAMFTPVYWLSQAINATATATGPTWQELAPVFGDLGLVALFALAMLVVALLVGRLRMGTLRAKSVVPETVS